jgi:hypothetical protein
MHERRRVTVDRAPESVEVDRAANRRLDPLLIDVDRRLQEWAPWARPYYLARGFPVQPGATPAGNDARCSASRGAARPAQVIATDEVMQELYWCLAAAVMAHYFNPEHPAAQRAAVYAQLVRHFVSLRAVLCGSPIRS